jgi:Cupredoxin-like domain
MALIMCRKTIGWLGLALALGPSAGADELPTVPITIKDHRFVPAEVHVKTGQPTFLEVTNEDATAEEFESGKLAIEKVVVAGGKVKIRLRPLGPGRYTFFGDYHQDTAQGVIVSE